MGLFQRKDRKILMPQATPLLEVRGVYKSFPGVKALRNVSLSLGQGEVLAVIGENGAGKSTLMKILGGVQQPDEGEILLHGKTVGIRSVREAASHGIALIHQELNLSDNLDIGANLFLGREPRRYGWICEQRIRSDAKSLLDEVGLPHPPSTIVSTLSIGHQQMVEIAKSLSLEARVLIMDEPTSSLSQKETEQLFLVVRKLRDRGVSIVYISHRLGEVKELADRVMVLRDGSNAGELRQSEISRDGMVKLMVGRDLSQFYPRITHSPGSALLQVENLRTATYPKSRVSFEVKEREIVGIAGLVGAGRTEVLRALFGIDPCLDGKIVMGGRVLKKHTAADAIQAGMTLAPEDRKQLGLILEMSVLQNLSLASLRRDQSLGFLNKAAETHVALETIKQLQVKTPSVDQIVQFLSGGNQQKVVLGKWLAMKPKLLLLDEPTRGIDVGAKQEIYRLMEQLASKGLAVIFVSSEMEEIIGMSDRVLVMHEGRITGELTRSNLSEEAIMRLATGDTAVSV